MIKKIGYLAIAVFIFLVGYGVGNTPSTDEVNQAGYNQQYVRDLTEVAQDYKTIAGLCEEKYQYGIKGDFNTAYQIKGQMDVIYAQIQGILDKYSTGNKSL